MGLDLGFKSGGEAAGGQFRGWIVAYDRGFLDEIGQLWYTLLNARPEGGVDAEFVPVDYDHERLADEMRDESLPAEFVDTITSGWWTTCLEVLPAKERKRGRY